MLTLTVTLPLTLTPPPVEAAHLCRVIGAQQHAVGARLERLQLDSGICQVRGRRQQGRWRTLQRTKCVLNNALPSAGSLHCAHPLT